MATQPNKKASPVQEVCIDLPGEAVRCWRSDHKVKIILRKHRDVFFELNLTANSIYTVESTSDFYSPRDKKLLRKATFVDGERFNAWVGRNFKGDLVLKWNGIVMGRYQVRELDPKTYSPEPKVKPEPLMVIMGQRRAPVVHSCTIDDPFGIGTTQQELKLAFDPKLSLLRNFGSEFDYRYPPDPPEVSEYVAVTEALPHEIQPQVLKQLDSGVAVVGTAGQIFAVPKNEQEPTPLISALLAAARWISGNSILNNSGVKESLGYLQENFRSLDKIGMTVRIEAKVKGKYRVVFKGRPLTSLIGGAKKASTVHQTFALGSKGAEFLDGGYARTGKTGYGGFKRIFMTATDKFNAGLKIQGIGTVIDLFGDAYTVFGDKEGSRDFSEFLGRAGVSLAKAGATAAIGSLFATVLSSAAVGVVAAFGVAAAPVWIVALAVVGGFIAAAMLVDMVDDTLNVKSTVAGWAR